MHLKLIFLKSVSVLSGLCPVILLTKSRFITIFYNIWRLALLFQTLHSFYQHYTYLISSLKPFRSEHVQIIDPNLKIQATRFVRVVYVVTPMIAYVPLAILRGTLLILDVLNLNLIKKNISQIIEAFKEFHLNHPNLQQNSLNLSRNELLFLLMMLIAYGRNFLRSYGIEVTTRSRTAWAAGTYRPWHKTVDTYCKAIFTELTSLDVLALFVLTLLTWFQNSFKIINMQLRIALKRNYLMNENVCQNLQYEDGKFSELDALCCYQNLSELWKLVQKLIGIITLTNFLAWMITLNFASFFSLSLTNDNMGKYSNVLQITAQLNVLCILMRFLCFDAAAHDCEQQV